MKQKHLALALSAVFAATALAGCGSDSSDNYQPYPEQPSNPDQPGTDEPGTDQPGTDQPGTDQPGTDEPGTDQPGTDEPGTDEPGTDEPGTDEPGTNQPPLGDGEPTAPAEPGKTEVNSSVVGQQYIRGTESNFDNSTTTNPKANGNNGSATVTNFKTLQNDQMTNIVVAQYVEPNRKNPDGTPAIVQYVLGEKPNSDPQISAENSLQSRNDVDVLGAFVNIDKTQDADSVPVFDIRGVETVVNDAENITERHNSDDAFAEGKNDVRIFGALSTTATPDEVEVENFANSAAFRVKNADGTKADLEKFDAAGDLAPAGIKLNNVQYGRVTGDLDNKKLSDITGKTYIVGDYADKNIEGNTDQTDIYFYRGLNQTSIPDMDALQTKGGTYQYAGHALMYGIDNSFNGEDTSGGSNSVAYGTAGKGIGNFVQAEYDATNRKVNGSIYNVWNKQTADGKKVVPVDLVKFNGDVEGNTILGESYLTYKTADKGNFTGSFFGKNAQEMGGALNSITQEYGKSAWGGVFGAQKLEATIPDTGDTEPTLPPIFNTGKDSQ